MALISEKLQFTAHIEFDKESKNYFGYVPSLPALQSYAVSIDKLNENLNEVLKLCLEELNEEELNDSISHFVGTTIVHWEHE